MKKIMFNDRFMLTEAVLSGRKTQTRRIVSDRLWDMWKNFNELGGSSAIDEEAEYFLRHSTYKVGEVVAIAQCYRDVVKEMRTILSNLVNREKAEYIRETYCNSPGWSNKMFARDYLMPHHIRITGVRVERLQDISDEDCIKEGIRFIPEIELHYFERKDIKGFYFDTPREAFAALIDRISGKGTWASNPWIFVYEFELVD